jgi:hypothetical protein
MSQGHRVTRGPFVQYEEVLPPTAAAQGENFGKQQQ